MSPRDSCQKENSEKPKLKCELCDQPGKERPVDAETQAVLCDTCAAAMSEEQHGVYLAKQSREELLHAIAEQAMLLESRKIGTTAELFGLARKYRESLKD